MIELEQVSKSYGKVAAVRGVSLSLAPRQVVGLLGPNGAGKSTIIKMVTCLLAPTQGLVRVCGHDSIDDAHAARLSIGYLAEFAPLYPEMTAEGYLQYRASLYPLSKEQRHAGIEKAIDRCRLRDMRARRISALSKGYRQRVGLAAAILHEPKVVILDEPTTGLDPAQIRETRELFRDLATDKLVLLSSHILPEIESTCDRVVIIAQGRIRADGTPADLLRSAEADTATRCELAPPDAPRAADLATALRIAGAGSVTVDGPRLTIKPAPAAPGQFGPDPRHLVALKARELGLSLTELHTPRPTLEQVFMRVISEGAA